MPGLERAPAPQPAPGPAPAPPPPTGGSRKQLYIGVAIGVFGLLLLAGLLAEDESGVDGPGPGVIGAGAAPDITGMWRTASGEVYHFVQDGRVVQLLAQSGGQEVGQGHGELDGGLLRLAFTMRLPGMPPMSANCDLNMAPDQRSFSGICAGPNGPFLAQIFR